MQVPMPMMVRVKLVVRRSLAYFDGYAVMYRLKELVLL